MDHPFSRLMDRLYLACIWIAGMAIFVMSLIIPWGVFTRYVLGTGSQWPEPIAILLMMVVHLPRCGGGYRAGAHIAVDDADRPAAAGAAARAATCWCDVLMSAGVPVRRLSTAASLCIETMGPVDRRAALAAGGRDLPADADRQR